jgi:NitT/TauT family transport system substrate-binding protein
LNTKTVIRAALLFVSVVAIGCGKDSSRAPGGDSAGQQAPLRKLRMSSQDHLSQSPIMIAAAEGYFRDEGLDIEFVTGTRSQETLVALVTGDIDVRPGPIHAGFLSAIAQNAKIKAVADEGYLAKDACPYFGIMLRNSLDTSGSPPIKRMRAGSDGPSRYITERLLASRNIPIKNLEVVSLPEVVMYGSLENGAVDAIASTEPTLSRLKPISRLWLSGQQVTPDLQWGVIAFSERLLTADRDLGVRFLRAYRKGVAQFAQGKTQRNVEIISKATGDPADVIREACWPSFRADSRINWESIHEFQVWARANGMMEHTLTQAQVWDSSFLVASDSAIKK